MSVCCASSCVAPEKIQWSTDGRVKRGDRTLQTTLNGVSTALEVRSGIYLGGFKTDAQGIRSSYVVFVPASLREASGWSFAAAVQGFFQVDDSVHVLLASGGAFRQSPTGWVESELQFKPDSVVVHTRNGVIACNPVPVAMVSQQRGSCYAADGTWSVDVSWREVRPQVCGDEALVVVEQRRDALVAHRIGLKDGRIEATQPIDAAPASLCTLQLRALARP